MGEILTVKDVAQKFKMPVGTIHYLIQTNQIPFSRIGQRSVRFSSEQLQTWFDKRQGIGYSRLNGSRV